MVKVPVRILKQLDLEKEVVGLSRNIEVGVDVKIIDVMQRDMGRFV